MVGRTPEFLGKKIEAREIKLVALGGARHAALGPARAPASRSRRTTAGRRSSRPGPQGFSETLYAYLSQANNNGSAFAGYTGYVQPNAGNLGAHGVTFADIARRRGDARRRASSRSSSCSPSPARSRASASPRSALGTLRTDTADVRRPARRRRRADRRPDLLPRAPARARRPGPDRTALLNALRTMLNALRSPPSRSSSSPSARPRLPARRSPGISQVAFNDKANGSLRHARRQGRRVEADRRRRPTSPALLPAAAVGHRLQRDGDVLRQPRPEPARRRASSTATSLERLPRARRPVQPRSDGQRRVPVDAVTTSASGVDPHISQGQRRDPGPPRRRGARPPARDACCTSSSDNTDGRFLGVIGEPGVNVTRAQPRARTEARRHG